MPRGEDNPSHWPVLRAAVLASSLPQRTLHTAGARAGQGNESTHSPPLGISCVCHPPTHPVPPGDHVLSSALPDLSSVSRGGPSAQPTSASCNPCRLPRVLGGELLLEAGCEQSGGKSRKENLLDGKGGRQLPWPRTEHLPLRHPLPQLPLPLRTYTARRPCRWAALVGAANVGEGQRVARAP